MQQNTYGCLTPGLPDQILFHHHKLDRCAMVLWRGTHYKDLNEKRKTQLHEALNDVNDSHVQDLRMKLMAEGLIHESQAAHA